jgi:pimeloyl-ACP methyl ester carboxylesterase
LKAGRISEPLLDWSLSLQRDTDTMRNDGELIGAAGSRRGFDPSLTFDDALVASITTPTLFIWGDNDVFGSPDAARAFVGLLPNATLDVVPESGHLPWIDDAAAAGKTTAAFLGGAPA